VTGLLELNDAEPMLLDVLHRKGLLDAKALASAREALAKEKGSPERILVDGGFATDHEIARAYADELFLPLCGDGSEEAAVDQDLAKLLPEKLCRDKLIAPLALRDGALDVAFVSPDGIVLADELQLLTGLAIHPLIAPLSHVDACIDALYDTTRTKGAIGGAAEDFQQVEDPEAEQDDPDDLDECVLQLDGPVPVGNNGRIVRLVNHILEQAIRTGASDIHLEPFEDSARLRLRIDGLLHELPSPSKSVFVMVISRFKILAKMDIAEKRIPQDGAISVKSTAKRVDLRVNTVPTIYGEKMVMRILDKGSIPLELTGLGFDERQSQDLVESIKMPHGLALVTGPTGSGKSTTLYSCLNMLNEPDTNICTVEDPVEYKFKGMNQVQVKSQVGLTFSTALRAFLRQDPDVIMVGEVRDQETAEICLRAALTGHFVLSTIHTNDALSAVTRLQDMGIEPFLLSCTLRVLEAQRLVRKLCAHCKEPYECDPETAHRYGLEPGQILYRPKGCLQCRQVGYRGRMGVFEVIRITPKVARLIQVRTPLSELRQGAREEGMKMLFDSAMDKVKEGLTSLESALSVSMSGDD
jgi:type IV pilus assembly protein PilB